MWCIKGFVKRSLWRVWNGLVGISDRDLPTNSDAIRVEIARLGQICNGYEESKERVWNEYLSDRENRRQRRYFDTICGVKRDKEYEEYVDKKVMKNYQFQKAMIDYNKIQCSNTIGILKKVEKSLGLIDNYLKDGQRRFDILWKY
jgi:hypothetical protein